jgi:integrase
VADELDSNFVSCSSLQNQGVAACQPVDSCPELQHNAALAVCRDVCAGEVAAESQGMAIHKLSAGKIAKLTKNGMYGDGGNLWLQVTNNGAGKSWIFRWTERGTGRDRSIGLGPLHTVSLEEARQAALANRKLLLVRRDPKKERDSRILDEDIARGLAKTVRQVIEEYDRAIIAHSAPNTQIAARRALRNVNRTIGDMPIKKVDRKTILEKVLLRKDPDDLGLADLWLKKNPTGVRAQEQLIGLFKFAIDNGYVPTGYNPALWEHLRSALPKRDRVHTTKHRAALPYKDAPRFMEKLRAYRWGGLFKRYEGRPPIALWLELLILSSVRNSEVRLARWGEFDFERMIWNVPAEHQKVGGREVKQIPITKPMLAVLEEAKNIAYPKIQSPKHSPRKKHERPQIFPRARHTPDQSPEALVLPNSVNKPFDPVYVARFIREGLKEKNVTPHGFRSTIRDWMRAETDFKDILWKIQVGHAIGENKSDRSYGHDPLLEQRREMFERWGEFCSKPAPEGKVLRYKRRSA